MHATVTAKGQITLPAKLRRKLGLKPGDVLDFDEEAFVVKTTKQVDAARMKSTIGCLKKQLRGKTVEQWMEWLRGPVELP